MYESRSATVLLIEGNRKGEESFKSGLEKVGYKTVTFNSGSDAFAWLTEDRPDLIVVDSTSMRSTGTRICRRLRNKLGDVPIVHCRAANIAEDPTAEADVYLQRPFTPRKLINRVRALLPADPYREEVARFGPITLFITKRAIEVTGKGERRLTPKLVQLLEEFMRHPNEIISRLQLMRNVWGTSYIGDTRTLDVHIRWVREFIEKDASKPQLLRTVRSKGYLLTLPQAPE